MKVMNKYDLAQQPYGTAFYNIDEYGNITSGLRILASDTFFIANEPEFNGVLDLKPDLDLGNMDSDIKIGWESDTLDLPYWDDCSIDYDDNDMFLVLTKEEALYIINIAKEVIEGNRKVLD